MTSKTLFLVVIGWILLILFNYYFMNFFLLFIELCFLLIIFLYISVVQIVKLVKEWPDLTKIRLYKLFVFSSLFILTYNYYLISSLIEKADFQISYDARMEIIEQIKNGEIASDTGRDFWMYELPFIFPALSNGGNEIYIEKNSGNQAISVLFWTFRNFFESPSTHFIFTDDPIVIGEIEKKISKYPNENWKIREGWYRTRGEFLH